MSPRTKNKSRNIRSNTGTSILYQVYLLLQDAHLPELQVLKTHVSQSHVHLSSRPLAKGMSRPTPELCQRFEHGALAMPPKDPHCQRWSVQRGANANQAWWQCQLCQCIMAGDSARHCSRGASYEPQKEGQNLETFQPAFVAQKLPCSWLLGFGFRMRCSPGEIRSWLHV